MTAVGRIICIMAIASGLTTAGLVPVRAETAAATEQKELPLVTLASAERSQVVARVPISGTLVARHQVQVHARVSGYEITTIRVDVGDQVKAGDVLAELSDETLSAQLAQADAEYDRSEASVRQAKSQIDSTVATLTEAASTLDRTRSLRKSGNASQAVLDQAIATEAAAQAASAVATNGLEVAQAALAQADAARRLARLNLGYTRIVAPADGVVTDRNAELGALSGSGGDALFTLIADGEIELEAEVIETALARLQPGNTAEMRVAGLGTVNGELRLVPAAVDPVTRLGLARVSLTAQPGLRVGMFANGWLETERRDAVTVPLSAILADENGDRVQVVKGDRIETRAIRAGLIWDGRREVLEGLAPGEQVVARAGAFFSDGDQVRVAP